MGRGRAILIWAGLLVVATVPVAAALQSPLLAWRDPVYIVAGLAGIIGLALILFQPLLAAGSLPGLSGYTGRRVHRWVGAMLVAAVAIHVAALWLTSPPDVIDALLFVSPTPFSVWGVLAMWAVIAAAGLAALRRRLRLRPQLWRMAHSALAGIVVLGTVLHALLIQGTMETFSKFALCALVLAVFAKVLWDLRAWAKRSAARPSRS